MNESLADIEALALRCRSEESKSYVEEATLCYRAGAYRAAIVSVWVAVVFDLIDKIRELAVSGDAAAIALEKRFHTYIEQINSGNQQGVKNALEFEREVLELCRGTLQFFDQQQMLDLNRLREDRHRCAHPSFQQIGVPYRPSAEQARLHIRNAVVHVLAQPPVQGKAALAEIKKVVSSQYFPTTTEMAVTQLRNTGLANPSVTLVNSAVDSLVFGFLTAGDPLYEKKQAVHALNALYELHPGLYEARIGKQIGKAVRDIDDQRLIWVLYLATNARMAWGLLEQPAREKLTAFVAQAKYVEIAPALNTLAGFPQLRPAVEHRISEFDLDQLSAVVQQENVQAAVKERAIALLATSKNWGTTNSIFEKAIFQLFLKLSRQDVERIIRLHTEHGADIPGAHAFGLFIQKVREAALVPADELDALLVENGSGYLVPQADAAD